MDIESKPTRAVGYRIFGAGPQGVSVVVLAGLPSRAIVDSTTRTLYVDSNETLQELIVCLKQNAMNQPNADAVNKSQQPG